ncbi:amino acid permease [Candidatus Sororendozoicomonas aggregata]|uniref:amino acid permease n=1 Tax=Candidatus Sororendozoicomonas aggregata TaxID=3073239 RepID=UPI002ED6A1CE
MSETVAAPPAEQGKAKLSAIFGSAFIIGGTAVGAGMFSIPVASSGMWFVPTLIMLAVVWYCMYSAALYLMEANLRFPLGASFDTMAQQTIGTVGRLLNGASVAFVCYILTYAYISGGSSIVRHTVESISGIVLAPSLASLVFALVLGSTVVFGTRTVDRITTALIGAMVISFLVFVAGLLGHIETKALFPTLALSDTLPYSFAALSFITVSFGCQNCVPSVTRYLNKDAGAIRKAILIGSLIPLGFYMLWVTSIFGTLSRDQFPSLIAQGGNIGTLVAYLEADGLNKGMSSTLQLFSNMAVASSFLGVALSLFDYIADLFSFNNDIAGRLKTAAITFLPPTILGIMLPDGFISAISFAGVALTMFCILCPVVMAWIGRKQHSDNYQVPGGKMRMLLVLAFGIVSLVLAVMDGLSMLPSYGH